MKEENNKRMFEWKAKKETREVGEWEDRKGKKKKDI